MNKIMNINLTYLTDLIRIIHTISSPRRLFKAKDNSISHTVGCGVVVES